MKHTSWHVFQKIPLIRHGGWIILGLLILCGCATGSKPSYTVNKYLLTYASPSWSKLPQLSTALKFNRFSIVAAYNSYRMIFRPNDYTLDAFNYSYWAANPADMIGDRLLADMRSSGYFQVVFSRFDTDDARFILSGSVDDIYLSLNSEERKAVIGITLTLQDGREKEIGKRILMQKKYSRTENLAESSPNGYCRAASLAMQSIAGQAVDDIYQAVKARMSE